MPTRKAKAKTERAYEPKDFIALLRNFRDSYISSGTFEPLARSEGIEVLTGFLANWKRIEAFYVRYYATKPSIVLCGINPGRYGAGLTGVPFLDFASLSKLLPNVKRSDEEKSAQFFFQIVSHFGAEDFFRTFYVTNVSWVGYEKDGKNCNYDKLPEAALSFVEAMFRSEFAFVQPSRIISIGTPVRATVQKLFGASQIDTSRMLPHPRNCIFG